MTAKCGPTTAEHFYNPLKLHVSKPSAYKLSHLRSGKQVCSSVVPIAMLTAMLAVATIFSARKALIGFTNMALEMKNKLIAAGTTDPRTSNAIIKKGFCDFALGSIGAAILGPMTYVGVSVLRTNASAYYLCSSL